MSESPTFEEEDNLSQIERERVCIGHLISDDKHTPIVSTSTACVTAGWHQSEQIITPC